MEHICVYREKSLNTFCEESEQHLMPLCSLETLLSGVNTSTICAVWRHGTAEVYGVDVRAPLSVMAAGDCGLNGVW